MKITKSTAVVTVLVLAGISFGIGPSCSPAGLSRSPDIIDFGSNTSGSAALIYIAQDRGFFARENLTVNLEDYATGVSAIDAVSQGKINIAWSSEYPLVRKSFSKEGISAFVVINRFTDQYIFGRHDSGIKNISDLKGKSIGLPRNTIAEFYLTRFLELNGISLSDVSLVDVLPEEALNAISSGSVDAVVVWEPYSSQLKTHLADSASVWSIQNMQPGFGIISSRNDWLLYNPELVVRFLKSLVSAEDYLINNPDAARDIVQKELNFSDESISTLWSESRFSVSLDQSLITAMEDEARWMISDKLTDETQMPNFLHYIYEGPLKTIKPDVVNIIR
jgi:NitT/TauT family transport system substrate-binding protein